MRSSVIFGFLAVLLSISAVSAQTKEAFINDMNTLNYALALENFEAYLYAQYVATFPTAASAGVSTKFYEYLTTAKTAESTHAASLTAVIKASGWLPAPVCTYDLNQTAFGPLGNNATRWLGLLALVEDVGAGAYTYASKFLTNAGFLQYAATVATVEARHAAFLNALVGANGNVTFGTRFATAPLGKGIGYNDALDVATVVNALVANKFLVDCPMATGVTFDGTKTFGVFNHTGTGALVPKLANTFRTAKGTFTSAKGVAFLNQAQYAKDTLVLQYALTAENLEANFYALALNDIGRDAFIAGFNTSPYSTQTSGVVYDFLALTGAHEAEHAMFLTTVINARAANHAVPPCVYNYTTIGYTKTPTSFLTVARILENTGVSAYAGAITLLSDTDLVEAAASIALVEARHASYLNTLLGQTLLDGSDQSVDVTLTPVQVATALTTGLNMLTSCPNSTAADANSPGAAVYSSLTLPYGQLVPNPSVGFNDNGAYNTLGSNVKTSSTTTSAGGAPGTPSSAQTGSASSIVASIAVVIAAVALLF